MSLLRRHRLDSPRGLSANESPGFGQAPPKSNSNPREWRESLAVSSAIGRVVVAALTGTLAVVAPVGYLREVKPVLAEHCHRCHGASQQKGGLRPDTAALALKGGGTGPAFEAGKSVASLLIQAV